MKYRLLTVILIPLLGLLLSTDNFAQDSAKVPSATDAKPDSATAEIATIRVESEAFVTAFNKGDPKAIAALWTEDGEYIDDSGRHFVGRDAIEKGYADFFAAKPNAKIQIAIDSVRLLGSNTAIEDGRAVPEVTTGNSSGFTKYTVVHVKTDNKWLMASVRDAWIETPADVASAADLEWLVGTWSAEENGVTTESICRWVVEGRFLERGYTTTEVDGTKSSGVQLIGWNPLEGHVQSWNFSPDGGHAVGIWNPQQDGWTAQMRGTTGDGTPSSAINHLRKLDDNAYVWQSVQRTVGSLTLPDTVEVIWKRQPAKH